MDHLHLWTHWLAAAVPDDVRCYVHAKTPQPTSFPVAAWVDPDPIPTAWGSLSLVLATRRLFEKAWQDGCTSMLLLSGDMLPLQSFQAIRLACAQTQLSLQPGVGLNERQQNANDQRYTTIAPWFGLSKSALRKQNMFFAISAEDYALLRDLDPSEFPLQQLADEYFWVNALIRCGRPVRDNHFIYCNPDSTRTQALSFHLDAALLDHCGQRGYIFIRKVTSLDPQADVRLRQVYAGGG